MNNSQPAKPVCLPLVPGWVFELGLNAREFAVLLKLWRHRPSKGPVIVWPCRNEILRCVRINKDTLSDVLNRLEGLGLIRREASWNAGRKRLRYHLHVPEGAIIRKEGTITPLPLSETKGLASSGTEGRSSSEMEGRGRYTEKNSKEVCGVPPPEAHTHPLWFSEVQDSFPKVDCVALWTKFFRHYAEKNHPPTRERFETWCKTEKVQTRSPKRNDNAVTPEPADWREQFPESPLVTDKIPWDRIDAASQKYIHDTMARAGESQEQQEAKGFHAG